MRRFALFIAPLFLFFSSAEAQELPSIQDSALKLEKISPPFKCADTGKIRKIVAGKKLVNEGDIFIERKSGKNHDFVFLDQKKKVLTACFKGKETAAKLLANHESDDELYSFELQKPLDDFDRDGYLEFLVWDAQCVEGPCFGPRTLIRIGSKGLESVVSLSTDIVDIISHKGAKILKLEAQCWSYEFSAAFDYFRIAEFDKNRKLSVVSPRDVKKRFADLLPKVAAKEDHSQSTASKSNDPNEKEMAAYAKIQTLINKAYQGEPVSKLLAEYRRIAAPFGEQGLPIHCDVAEIIQAISSEE